MATGAAPATENRDDHYGTPTIALRVRTPAVIGRVEVTARADQAAGLDLRDAVHVDLAVFGT